MFKRLFNISKTKSFFVFGARGTGKSTLIKRLFEEEETIWIDLLDLNVAAKYARDPMLLERTLDAEKDHKAIEWVVIDEIQKIPFLLDVVHRIIEKKRFRFALTGSSARKLKRGSANLLAGRALQRFLFPLTYVELDKQFDLDFVLKWGSLPEVFSLEDDERMEYLTTYANTYLKEEIQVEQIVRKLEPFRAFLEVAAQASGKIINFSKIARDIDSDPVSVQSYFQILEDTLLGFLLKPFHASVRKRQRKNPKFYFFDLGVQNTLARRLSIHLHPGTYEYGNLFEQFIILEIYRLIHYHKKDWELFYLRTKDDVEVDLIIDRPGEKTLLLEIKSCETVSRDCVKSLSVIGRDMKNVEMCCLSRDSTHQIIENVECVYWQDGLRKLFKMIDSNLLSEST